MNILKPIIRFICICFIGKYKRELDNFNPFVLPSKRDLFFSKIIKWCER